MKVEGSGSISQRHGSADPDPQQNVIDPQHCEIEKLGSGISIPDPKHWLADKICVTFDIESAGNRKPTKEREYPVLMRA